MFMRKRCLLIIVLACVIKPIAHAAPIPTFEQLDQELTTYKKRATLEGESNAHLHFHGLAFYCIFDMFLTVMGQPEHPRHRETRQVWDHNHTLFSSQAGWVARAIGRNLLPLLISTSALYAEDFQKSAARYAPRFSPSDYRQPMAVEIKVNDKMDKAAWWHAEADADGDMTTNLDELKQIAPQWNASSQTPQHGSDYGLRKMDREQFIQAALGCPIWWDAHQEEEISHEAARE